MRDDTGEQVANPNSYRLSFHACVLCMKGMTVDDWVHLQSFNDGLASSLHGTYDGPVKCFP